MRVLFRTDASNRIGTGHVMRCLTLAEELQNRGASCHFICREHPGHLKEWIATRGFTVSFLPNSKALTENEIVQEPRNEYARWLGVSQEQDALDTRASLGSENVDWLIVDHYGLDARYEEGLRNRVKRIFIIDDLADRKHECDALLDQNYYKSVDNRYQPWISPGTAQFLGPKFALLRPEFRNHRAKLFPKDGRVRRVFVFFGGTDSENLTGLVLETLSQPEFRHLRVDVVVGANHPNRFGLEAIVRSQPQMTIHFQVSLMAPLMLEADLAIGAGGTTTWERFSLGLPTIMVTVANNQVPIAKDLNEGGYILWIGSSEDINSVKISEALRFVIGNNSFLVDLSKKVLEMVDGGGAVFVSNFLMGIRPIHHVRAAVPGDCELFWYWANDPEVRQNAFQPDPIPLSNHRVWFKTRLADPLTGIFVMETEYGPVGQLRLEGPVREKTISYSIARPFRGMGFGQKIIEFGLQNPPSGCEVLVAEVKENNKASLKIFEKLGFQSSPLPEKKALVFRKIVATNP